MALYPSSSRLLRAGTALALAGQAALLPSWGPRPAAAQQQGQEWFVPNQGGGQQQRHPQQQQQQQQRPPQPQQRPAAQQPRQAPPAPVIGIVDVPEVQRDSTAFNQVREEIERRRQRLNDDLQREQNAWREAQQQLANQRASMPPEQLRQRERDLQDRITDSQRVFRERSRGIEQAAQQALVEIEQGLAQVIRQVAAGRGVNLVLARQLVILNEPPFDLTGEVTQQFNRTLRSVTIPPDQSSEGTLPPTAQQQQQQQRPAAPGGAGQTGQRR